MYYQILKDAALNDSTELRRFFKVYNEELIHRIDLKIDALYIQRRLVTDFDYKNILSAEESGLEAVRDMLE